MPDKVWHAMVDGTHVDLQKEPLLAAIVVVVAEKSIVKVPAKCGITRLFGFLTMDFSTTTRAMAASNGSF